MSRQHVDIWSHPSCYLVDPYSSPWSPKGHGHDHEWVTAIPFVKCQFALRFLRNGYFKIWPCKLMVKAIHVVKWQGHNVGSAANHLTSISSIGPAMPEIQLFKNWPWKSKIKVMAKVKTNGYIWGLVFNPYVCFSDHCVVRYSKLNIWRGKFNFKVMAKVISDGHTWGPGFNRYVCFLFHGPFLADI